ncbi:MAG: hypothetical protein ACJ764_12525 [Solirubrobacteraceae bacterium]
MRRKILCGGLLVALALAGCGGSGHPTANTPTATAHGTLDTSRVARAIQASILAQRHIHATVSCPHNVPLRKGWHFVCFATTGAGQTPFVVTEVNGRGSTTYVGK